VGADSAASTPWSHVFVSGDQALRVESGAADRRLQICIDTRLRDGEVGGVQQFVIGLAAALAKLADGNEDYLFLAYQGCDDWLRPYVDGQIIHTSLPAKKIKRNVIAKLPVIGNILRRLRARMKARSIQVAPSDGTIEQVGADIMHFTTQNGFLTDVPSIYHPWDLQHIHLPQFFSYYDYRFREITYRKLCEQARMVAVASEWGKRDLVEQYRLPPDKVRVVPIAPVLAAYPTPMDADLSAVRQKFALPDQFIFYPAQTWPHKNHLKLLDALALLRNLGLPVSLVCSGRLSEFFPTIEQHMERLSIGRKVQFLGFVTPLELQCLYKLSTAVVFPSKFEGWGMPITEAFLAGVPVACSNVTLLPELVGNATLLFDPDNSIEIADAIRRLWTDPALRESLIGRGKQISARYSWDRTARVFRAHYRRIAGRALTDEDRALLA
jgi:glycosyltransferase involved in cell wall biosynthesis